MSRRIAAVLCLGIAACAHSPAFDRDKVGEMKNASPAISPWPGPPINPVAWRSPDPPGWCYGRRRPVAFANSASLSALARSCETGT